MEDREEKLNKAREKLDKFRKKKNKHPHASGDPSDVVANAEEASDTQHPSTPPVDDSEVTKQSVEPSSSNNDAVSVSATSHNSNASSPFEMLTQQQQQHSQHFQVPASQEDNTGLAAYFGSALETSKDDFVSLNTGMEIQPSIENNLNNTNIMYIFTSLVYVFLLQKTLI